MSPALPTIDGPRARAVTGTGRTISGVLVFLGLMGVLRTSIDDLGADSAEPLFIFTVHPLTGLAWLAIGVVGVGMCATPRGARRFLVGGGLLLLLWALVALIAGDALTQVFVRDAHLVAMHGAFGLVALFVGAAPFPAALVRALERPPTPPPPRPGGGGV